MVSVYSDDEVAEPFTIVPSAIKRLLSVSDRSKHVFVTPVSLYIVPAAATSIVVPVVAPSIVVPVVAPLTSLPAMLFPVPILLVFSSSHKALSAFALKSLNMHASAFVIGVALRHLCCCLAHRGAECADLEG